MRHEILRTIAGPKEWEIRFQHRHKDEVFYYFEQFNNSEDLKHLIPFATKKLIHFIFQSWYQTHGQGD